jgi:tetratricopeptide (TPR) repeat protein
MTRDEGLKLLLCEPNMLQADKDEGARIVDRLGGLALAIDQAAAYIEWKRIAIKDFLPAYEVKRQNILDYTPDFGWEYSTMQVHGQAEKDKALSAFTTWDMSFQQLIPNDPQRQESAAHFLTLHAFLDYLNVAEDLFRTFWEAEESPPEWLKIFVKSTEEDSDSDGSVEDDSSSYEDSLARAHSSSGQSRRPFRRIDTIQSGTQSRSQDSRTKNSWKSEMFQDLRAKCLRLSLLRVQSDDGQPNRHHQMFSLHPLIRDWLQLRAKKNQRRRYCQEAIGIVLVSINSFGNQSTTADQKQALLAHMDACISNDKRFSKTRRTLGYDHSDTASIFGNMYRDQGRLKEAEELEVQVIETRKKVLGAEHPDTLTSMANLASTFWNQGRWKEAEELDVQVMETRKRVLGAEHPGTLTSMANLASTYRNQGRWKEAEELEVQVMETSNRVLGAEHPDTLTSMGNLASTFWNQGRWKEAEELEVQVMETSNMVLGAEHPDTLTSMNNLAHTWKGHGRDTEALKLMEECLIVRIRILGTNHYSALSSRTTLLGWQTEELEIVASADKDLDV